MSSIRELLVQSLYAFMAWCVIIGTDLTFPLTLCKDKLVHLCKEFYQLNNIVVCVGAFQTTEGQHCTIATTHGSRYRNITIQKYLPG